MIGIWEGTALALACSLDAFASGFAYGSRQIRIPWLSGLLITAICTCFLGFSLWLGGWIRQFLPEKLTSAACFGILFTLGVIKLIDGIRKKAPDSGNADRNGDMVISLAEGAVLAVGLSMDGLAVGFGAGFGKVNAAAAVIASLVIGTAAVMGGGKLGGKLARALAFNISWAGGAILIGLAFLKLF